MTSVLDAYAVVAALVGEPARAEVEPLLKSGLLCAPNVAEVLDVCVRVHGNEEPLVRERFGWLVTGGLEVISFGDELALLAGSLRARHYRKQKCEVSHGDCAALALALQRKVSLATSDPALAAAARTEGVKLIALPDSAGLRPAVR